MKPVDHPVHDGRDQHYYEQGGHWDNGRRGPPPWAKGHDYRGYGYANVIIVPAPDYRRYNLYAPRNGYRWVRDDPCTNMGVSAWILRTHMNETGSLAQAIANYHSRTPQYGYPYKSKVVQAMPDGYTVGFGHLGTHVANGAIYKLSYDLVKDLEPVVRLPSNPMIIVSKKSVPAKNLQELLKPRKILLWSTP